MLKAAVCSSANDQSFRVFMPSGLYQLLEGAQQVIGIDARVFGL